MPGGWEVTGTEGSSGPGGSGPPGTSGGTGGEEPSLPSPGDGLFTAEHTRGRGLGAPEAGGQPGDTPIVNETPGDLGSQYLNLNRFLLLAESRRENADVNGITSVNHRHRGHREGSKFNLILQKLITLSCSFFLTLRTWNTTLKTRETTQMYPSDTEIENIYHIQAQIQFKEWQLMKDDNRLWFINE